MVPVRRKVLVVRAGNTPGASSIQEIRSPFRLWIFDALMVADEKLKNLKVAIFVITPRDCALLGTSRLTILTGENA